MSTGVGGLGRSAVEDYGPKIFKSGADEGRW